MPASNPENSIACSIGNSYPIFVHDNIVYFDKIARLNLANDTSFVLKDTLFQLNRNTSIQIFFKDKMYLLNNIWKRNLFSK